VGIVTMRSTSAAISTSSIFRATNPDVTVRLGTPLLSEGQLMFTWPH
jgi:hypothetical protein